MRTSKIRFFAVAALAAVALAACSSSSKARAPPTPPTSPGRADVTDDRGRRRRHDRRDDGRVASSKYGKILVDSKGMTLYVDEKDKPGKPACTGACLQAWPPLAASGIADARSRPDRVEVLDRHGLRRHEAARRSTAARSTRGRATRSPAT